MPQNQFTRARRFSHAYIVSAAAMGDAADEARRIAAAAVCSGTGEPPCGRCRDCRKADAGIHPDIITVRRPEDDKGRQKKEIGVDQIREVIRDAYVAPNEAERKVYIVEDADLMNLSAQNAALKLLEEPPGGVILLLCVKNAGQLLPTVRSRCVQMGLNGEEDREDEELTRLAAEYLRLVTGGDRLGLCAWCSGKEDMDSHRFGAFITALRELLIRQLCEGKGRLPSFELMRLVRLTDRCSERLRVNVGVKHLFGLLAVDSIADSGN